MRPQNVVVGTLALAVAAAASHLPLPRKETLSSRLSVAPAPRLRSSRTVPTERKLVLRQRLNERRAVYQEKWRPGELLPREAGDSAPSRCGCRDRCLVQEQLLQPFVRGIARAVVLRSLFWPVGVAP